jgi:hypothetical protein
MLSRWRQLRRWRMSCCSLARVRTGAKPSQTLPHALQESTSTPVRCRAEHAHLHLCRIALLRTPMATRSAVCAARATHRAPPHAPQMYALSCAKAVEITGWCWTQSLISGQCANATCSSCTASSAVAYSDHSACANCSSDTAGVSNASWDCTCGYVSGSLQVLYEADVAGRKLPSKHCTSCPSGTAVITSTQSIGMCSGHCS